MNRTLIAIMLLVVAPAALAAQISRVWTYEDLRTGADVVVVATPISTRTAGQTELSGLEPPLPVVELRTRFRLLSTLKGQIAGDTIELRHFKLDESRLPGGCLNCGGFGDLFSSSAGSPRCDYLMYLHRSATGAFEPVSGQVFPLASIFSMQCRQPVR